MYNCKLNTQNHLSSIAITQYKVFYCSLATLSVMARVKKHVSLNLPRQNKINMGTGLL